MGVKVFMLRFALLFGGNKALSAIFMPKKSQKQFFLTKLVFYLFLLNY